MTRESELFHSLLDMLKHVREVEESVMKLSKDSMLKVSRFIEQHQLPVDGDMAWALQHQDIISQQLSATSEAMMNVEKSIERYVFSMKEDTNMLEDNIKKLDAKLKSSLEEARSKKDRFSGKTKEDSEESGDGVEFF